MSTKTKKTKAQEPASPPVAKLRIGLINASIWERKTEENGTFYAVTFERRYRDKKKGEWQSSHSYDTSDLLTLAKVADSAHTKILDLQASQDE